MTSRSILEGISALGGEESASVVNALFDDRKGRLKMITEITPDLIYPLSLLLVVASKYKSKVLDSFVNELFKLQISRDRKGRGELIEALLSARTAESLNE